MGQMGSTSSGALAGKVLRIAPPLIICEKEAHDAIDLMHKLFAKIRPDNARFFACSPHSESLRMIASAELLPFIDTLANRLDMPGYALRAWMSVLLVTGVSGMVAD